MDNISTWSAIAGGGAGAGMGGIQKKEKGISLGLGNVGTWKDQWHWGGGSGEQVSDRIRKLVARTLEALIGSSSGQHTRLHGTDPHLGTL